MDTMQVPQMVTIKQASEMTGVSYDAIRRMCLNNQIVYIRAGKKFLINLGKLVEYLNTGEKEEADGCREEGIFKHL